MKQGAERFERLVIIGLFHQRDEETDSRDGMQKQISNRLARLKDDMTWIVGLISAGSASQAG